VNSRREGELVGVDWRKEWSLGLGSLGPAGEIWKVELVFSTL